MPKSAQFSSQWPQSPDLAQQLFDDPDTFLATHEVGLDELACPQDVLDAIERARALTKAMATMLAKSRREDLPLPEIVKSMRATVAQHFGEDFVAEAVPFGFRFKERVRAEDLGLVVGATIECTNPCKDGHTDYD